MVYHPMGLLISLLSRALGGSPSRESPTVTPSLVKESFPGVTAHQTSIPNPQPCFPVCQLRLHGLQLLGEPVKQWMVMNIRCYGEAAWLCLQPTALFPVYHAALLSQDVGTGLANACP